MDTKTKLVNLFGQNKNGRIMQQNSTRTKRYIQIYSWASWHTQL